MFTSPEVPNYAAIGENRRFQGSMLYDESRTGKLQADQNPLGIN